MECHDFCVILVACKINGLPASISVILVCIISEIFVCEFVGILKLACASLNPWFLAYSTAFCIYGLCVHQDDITMTSLSLSITGVPSGYFTTTPIPHSVPICQRISAIV